MDDRRNHLATLAEYLRNAIREQGYATGGTSQIVPQIVGDDQKAVELAQKYQDAGILVFPIRHPTVPKGTARLRFSLSAALDLNSVEEAAKACR